MEKYSAIVDYLNKYWVLLIRNARMSPKRIEEIDEDQNIFLPYDYVTPGGLFDTMFYWDSFFIIVGLRRNPKYHYLVKHIVDNCLYMVAKSGRVLNCNKKRWASRSQLPYLTSMINIVYDIYSDDTWLDYAYTIALREYEQYWCSGNHVFDIGLSRFYEDSGDNFMTRNSEASWDTSPRYDDDDTTDLAPIDLNANLFLYEIHFSQYFSRIGDHERTKEFEKKAQQRKETVKESLWCEKDGLYYDFNVSKKTQKRIKSLASFVPLWAGLVDEFEARKIVSNLDLFEHDFGLATCSESYSYSDRQWNYPYGWAPLHWMVFKGLRKYGFSQDAYRIAKKWLNLNLSVFEKTHLMWEKYDVVNGERAEIFDRYPPQHGFGWTNGVFLDLFEELRFRDK